MVFYSKQTAVVLLLHRVLPVRDTMWDPMDPQLFERVLQYVQRNFHALPLNELLFDRPRYSAKPLAAITFDDGYRDFIDYSIPLLKKYQLPASMFVTTDCIDQNLPTWTYVLDYYFENTSVKSLSSSFDNSKFPQSLKATRWNAAAERIAFGKKIKQYLKWMPAAVRKKAIAEILASFNDIELKGGMMMNWEEVKQIHAAGYEVGPHSVSHPTLATIEDDAELNYELQYAGGRLKEKTGIDSTVFSYPCGSYDERVKTQTKAAGYAAGLAVDRQLYQPDKDDLFAVPRIELYNEAWTKSRMRMNGTISFIEKIIKR